MKVYDEEAGGLPVPRRRKTNNNVEKEAGRCCSFWSCFRGAVLWSLIVLLLFLMICVYDHMFAKPRFFLSSFLLAKTINLDSKMLSGFLRKQNEHNILKYCISSIKNQQHWARIPSHSIKQRLLASCQLFRLIFAGNKNSELISVVFWFVRAFRWNAKVLALIARQFRKHGRDTAQVSSSNLLVQFLRQDVDLSTAVFIVFTLEDIHVRNKIV